jgi:periplasmic protein TonB
MSFLRGAAWLAATLCATAPAQEPVKKVSKAEALEAATSKAAPEYPAVARQLRIQGAVELEAEVTETGAVEKVTIVSGNPVLTKPAADALKKWKFKPFTIDGKPARAVAPVSFTFRNE